MKDLATPAQARESRLTRTPRDEDGAASIMFPKRHLLDMAAHHKGLKVDILRLPDEGLTLGRVVSGGHEIVLEDPENIMLLLPLQGRIALQTGQSEHAFASGSHILVEAEKRRTRVTAPKGGLFRAITLQIPRNWLMARRATGPASVKGLGDRTIRTLDTAFARQIGRLLPGVAEDIFRQPDRFLTPRAIAEFVSVIDDLMVDASGLDRVETRIYGGLREFQRVSQACDIMQARGEEALSMADLAAELGVTPRCLQMSFRAVHGVSPRQYLERVRLDRVRAKLLLQGDAGSITSAALDCGFLHLGRFSQSYRRAFGELPSGTKARRPPLSDRTVSHSG